ncbi:MAG: hypothetical protein FJ271_08350 [Planctomycetes bacterium]|nr:hypothetical protein [Planctomycetota bacterium]
MHNRYKDKVQFLAVYVREAHPSDGWASPGNEKVGIAFLQPRTLAERIGVAQKCSAALEINMPLLVDDVNDRVGHAYSGMPDRLYIIDRAGKVAYQGGRGPFGFKPGEMEQAVAMLLLDQESTTPLPQGRLPALQNSQAWKRLPATNDESAMLPAWARMLAGVMPKTTARMIELDAMHRTGTRLDAKLRAMMRWSAADENQCAAGRAFAERDLRDAGMSDSELHAFTSGGVRTRSAREGAALAFARKMMRAAHAVTDAEVKFLNDQFGEKQLVAMVALLAHASFQDRMLLALDAPAEKSPPLLAKFARPKRTDKKSLDKKSLDKTSLDKKSLDKKSLDKKSLDKKSLDKKSLDKKALDKKAKSQASSGPVVALPPRATTRPPGGVSVVDPQWRALGVMDLRSKMDAQKSRPPRIRVPTNDELRKAVPGEHRMAKGSKVVWSQVCYGYQPALTDAWFSSVSTFREEAKLDRVLQTSMFWVVTRALQCFY